MGENGLFNLLQFVTFAWSVRKAGPVTAKSNHKTAAVGKADAQSSKRRQLAIPHDRSLT
jgi:hypothetical protein